ncbi:RNA 2',3'-cyclic phosphodiesterase [Coriobacteriales bacterium OH1046]|nr:RNA 2',3'-cyclic phosphodiesterase [Coriobacteriales bacterium OH1046]
MSCARLSQICHSYPMRLFIAAELPQGLTEALAETSALLREAVSGRYVAPDRFHITLAFLGETDAACVQELSALLMDACTGFPPIEVHLGALGSFGRRKRAALWQEVRSGGRLEALAGKIRRSLDTAGFPFDGKGFRAHVTLMRAADLSGGALPMPHAAAGTIGTVALFKSDLSRKHPVYTPLSEAALGDGG